jgi:ADP-heptose:LPS heptosyltransferase
MRSPLDPSFRPPQAAPRILVVRRDNIGDLVCTLPVFEGIRQHYPDAHIGALVNSYNAPLLERNPYVDRVHIYTKSKHRPDAGLRALVRDRLRLVAGLRKESYQVVLHAGSRPRSEMRALTRLAGISEQVVGQDEDRSLHEVDRVYGLLRALDIPGPPPAPRLVLARQAIVDVREALTKSGYEQAIGLHISAREDENRWPLENFETLIRSSTKRGYRFLVFWSPGDVSRAEHPGDDARARELLDRCRELPVLGHPTSDLLGLAAGLAAVRVLVGSDGGHVHIAAAVGTPVIGLYCEHKVNHWRPRGAGHVVLQGKRVDAISPDAVLAILDRIKVG